MTPYQKLVAHHLKSMPTGTLATDTLGTLWLRTEGPDQWAMAKSPDNLATSEQVAQRMAQAPEEDHPDDPVTE